MTKSPGNGGNNDKNSNNSSNGNDKGSQNSNGFKDFLNNAANTVKNYGTEISNKLSEMGARINSAISKPEMAACGFIAGTGLVSLSLGIGNTAAATGGAPFTAGLSLGIMPATTSKISSGFLMASSGLGCMSGLLFNAAMGGDGSGENGGYGRGGQKLKSSEAAKGADQTSFKTDQNGKVTNYETYTKQTNPRNPNPYEVKRFDGTHSHNGMQPHVHDFKTPNKVRTPELNELPKGY
ncbi:hypothetical protein GCL60_04100 [Silvanigrella paludirubra]|uniref:Bacterial toxin 24 domain-containing protein n=1 Tax=Silvanigrella paludirubra TaxID=2499159 RepID=A0A6N6VTE5_9BACT|nr:hypothetical protein [Silvanigrella paludirubra]KAB8039443.1 hypothetical protein GCL60_04100 [Silvanigrella paludirubra]